MIRIVSEDDIANIIELHLKSFSKNHFTSVFSRDLLQKYFRKLIAINKFCFVYYNEKEEELLGYIIAGFNTGKALSQFTHENKYNLMFTLLKNPRFLLEKVGTVLKQLVKKNVINTQCRLFLIAVNENHKGEGIGRKLINYFEHQLRQGEIKDYGLSVRKENSNAIRFYNSGGYIIDSEDSKSISYKKEVL
jgi:ribosomal protein S18 acetylase RimI-like enzyme